MPTFQSHPGELELLHLLRRLTQGHSEPWIYQTSVYGVDPDALTAAYPPATAADGEPAWYFLYTPQKKSAKDSRISRVAGRGFWKGERLGKPLLNLSQAGVRVKAGSLSTLTYLLKRVRGQPEVRLGWLINEYSLLDGEDAMGRVLCKLYPTPRPVPPAPPAAAVAIENPPATAAPVPAPPAPAAAPATEASPLLDSTPAAAAAVAIENPPATAAPATEAPPLLDSTPAPAAPSAPAASAPSAPAASAPSAPAASAPSAPAASAPSAPRTEVPSSEASPPKKWIKILVSNSPTKKNETSKPKRVFGMLDLLEQEDMTETSNKRMRGLDYKGWVVIEPCT